jgi:hypothetical protein
MRLYTLILVLSGCLLAHVGHTQIAGKLDGHVGYSVPLGKNYPINGGPALSLEPKFWFNDEIVVGAKLGVNLLASPVQDVRNAPLANLMLVGEKYQGEEDFVLFYGAAVGVHMGGHIKKISGVPTDLRAPRYLGLSPRAGVQFGQYRLMGELHLRQKQAKFVSIMIGYTLGSE